MQTRKRSFAQMEEQNAKKKTVLIEVGKEKRRHYVCHRMNMDEKSTEIKYWLKFIVSRSLAILALKWKQVPYFFILELSSDSYHY